MRLILNAGGSNEGVKRNRSYKWDYFMSMNKSKKILNEWLFRIFYGASRGIRIPNLWFRSKNLKIP